MIVERLDQVKDHARSVLADERAVLSEAEALNEWRMFGGIVYGETARLTCVPLASLKGKGTRACFHLIVERLGMDHARYGHYEIQACYVS